MNDKQQPEEIPSMEVGVGLIGIDPKYKSTMDMPGGGELMDTGAMYAPPKRPNFSQIEEPYGNLLVRYERYVLRGRVVWTCTFYHEQHVGVDLVQTRVGGGAAICRPEDLTRFSDEMGKRIARGRALKCVYDNLPQLAVEGVDPGIDWDSGRPSGAPVQLELYT